MSTDKNNLKNNWDYEVSKIQSTINNTDSILQGKIITKIDFTIKNRKHVWMKTIEKMPNPLQPDKTVGESNDLTISKYKNHITLLISGGKFKIVSNGTVRDVRSEDYNSRPIKGVGVKL